MYVCIRKGKYDRVLVQKKSYQSKGSTSRSLNPCKTLYGHHHEFMDYALMFFSDNNEHFAIPSSIPQMLDHRMCIYVCNTMDVTYGVVSAKPSIVGF